MNRLINVADVGGTKTSFAQMRDEEILWAVEVPTPEVVSVKSFGDWLIGQWVELAPSAHQKNQATAIAISTTGVVHGTGITSLNPKTLKWPDPFPLKQTLEGVSGLPTWILNDAQAAAWAEFQAIKKIEPSISRVMYITISTGIGAGLVIDGQLFQSPRGLATHAGHMTVSSKGLQCGCGRTGCIESLSSGRAIQEQIHALGLSFSVQEAFEKREQAALKKIFTQAASYVAQAISNVHALVDLDHVVIGGGLGLQSDFFQWIRDALNTQPEWSQVSVLSAKCGRQSCLQGAGDWANAQLAKAHPAPFLQNI